MAPAVPLVAAVAGSYIPAAIGLTGLAATIGGFVVSTAINQVAGRALAKKPKAQAFSTEANGRAIMVRSSIESHKIVYGTMRVSGAVVHITTENDTSSSNGDNRFLHMIVALAGHEVEEIGQVYLNDRPIALDGNGEALISPWLNDTISYARIRKFTGASDQLADPTMISEIRDWTENHRLRGIAYLWVRLRYSDTVFPNGIPNISAVVKGRKVYDPRTDTTGWSQNSALCIRDYLTSVDGVGNPYGFGCEDDEIDDDYFIAAANTCDENVTRKSGLAVNRYTCNGVVDTAQAPLDNLQSLVTSLAGAVTYVQGKFRVHAAVYDTPAGAIDASMLTGEVDIVTDPSRKELFNAVKGTYVDPDKSYLPTDFPMVANATYETQDGEQIIRDLELPFTTNAEDAQRIAKLVLEKGRQGITVEMPVSHAALKYSAFDVVTLTLDQMGWDAKPFRIMKWSMATPGPIVLSLQEESSASYDWNGGEATTIDPAPDTNLPSPWEVGEPQGVAAQSGEDQLLLAGDGTVISRILVSWSPTTDAFVAAGKTEIQFKRSTDSVWANATANGDDTSAFLTGVDDGASYDIRLRFRNSIGSRSGWTQISHTVIGKTLPPNDVVIFDIEGNKLSWTGVTNVDLAGYRIRYQPGTNRSWGDAIPLHAGLVTDSPYTMTATPPNQVTLMIKAVDTSGNESVHAAYIVTNFGDPDVANILVQYDRKASLWPGTLTGGTINGSNNLEADALTYMWNADSGVNMWSTDSTVNMWNGTTYSAMTYEDRITVSAALAGSTMTIASTITGDPWSLKYRENSSELMWGEDSSALMWSDDDTDLMWYTPDWLPWPGSIEVKNSIYDFLITTGQGLTQGMVSEFTITIDAPDIEEIFNDVSVSSAGTTRLSLTKTFQVISNVQLTVQSDGGSAVTARYVDKDASLGPNIQTLNTSGALVNGTIDARIKGY